jgi:hypothetical protein
MKMVLCSSSDGTPFTFKKKNRVCRQFSSTDYLRILLTPPRIPWTIPLMGETPISFPSLPLFTMLKLAMFQ